MPLRPKPRQALPVPATADEFATRLMAEHARLRERLPDMHPDELLNILHSVLRPWGSGRRFLLRRRDDGTYIFGASPCPTGAAGGRPSERRAKAAKALACSSQRSRSRGLGASHARRSSHACWRAPSCATGGGGSRSMPTLHTVAGDRVQRSKSLAAITVRRGADLTLVDQATGLRKPRGPRLRRRPHRHEWRAGRACAINGAPSAR